MCKWYNCILCFIISNKSNWSFWHFHRTESKSAYKLFTKFSTNSNEISPFQPEFNVNLDNHSYILTYYSPLLLFYTPWKHQKTFRFSDIFKEYRKATLDCNGLSKILSQSRSTINLSLSEPERLFTTTSQPARVMSSNSLVSFQPPPYQISSYEISSLLHLLILFLQRHNPVLVVVGIHEDTPLTKTSVCTGLVLIVLVTKSRRPMEILSLFICYFLLFSDFYKLEFSSHQRCS